MRRLSELEGAVLSLIWRDGPMTGYAVRSVFGASPTGAYGFSTGSIYPLIKRLQRDGLIATSPRPDDARGTHELSLTPTGKRAVRTWLKKADEQVLALPADPVRLRVLFMGLLSESERQDWLQRAEEGLRNALDTVERMQAQLSMECSDDMALHSKHHATRMAVEAARARIDYLPGSH